MLLSSALIPLHCTSFYGFVLLVGFLERHHYPSWDIKDRDSRSSRRPSGVNVTISALADKYYKVISRDVIDGGLLCHQYDHRHGYISACVSIGVWTEKVMWLRLWSCDSKQLVTAWTRQEM